MVVVGEGEVRLEVVVEVMVEVVLDKSGHWCDLFGHSSVFVLVFFCISFFVKMKKEKKLNIF